MINPTPFGRSDVSGPAGSAVDDGHPKSPTSATAKRRRTRPTTFLYAASTAASSASGRPGVVGELSSATATEQRAVKLDLQGDETNVDLADATRGLELP